MPGPKPSKKPKPTFDVARDPIPESKSGWVYRTEPAEPPRPEPAIPAPPPPPAAQPVRPQPAPSFQRTRPSPPPPAPAAPSRSWLATGFYLMTLPMTIGMTIMFAPVTWMLGGRSKR